MKTKSIHALRIIFLLSLIGLTIRLSALVPHPSKEMKQTIDPDGPLRTFLENPTNYNFLCTSTSHGEVLKASITSEGILTIHYASTWEDGDHSGVAFGGYNPENHRFDGRYKTYDGRFEGEINFTFSDTGEAHGTWDHGYGTISIPLKDNK